MILLSSTFGNRNGIPPDFEKIHTDIIELVSSYTMTSVERVYVLIESVRYILRNKVQGVFLECGVYKGGSMMAIALTLIAEGVTDRDLYLFDTFEGMPIPSVRDVDIWGNSAIDEFSRKNGKLSSSDWANASLEEVRQAMALTGYPSDRVHFVKGMVETTIPNKALARIALLRLDTDWYQSTMHELQHLFPILSERGILIVDDYGHFKGSKEAVDEYFEAQEIQPFLHRIDYTARLIIKDSIKSVGADELIVPRD